MKAPLNDPLLARLCAGEEAACLGILAQLCRTSPAFRAWLWDDFGRDPKVRKRLATVLDRKGAALPAHFHELTDTADAWREEQRQLRAVSSAKPFGGLSRTEVETLVRGFQAGHIDVGTFALVRDWSKAGEASPAAMWGGLLFLDQLIPARSWRLHMHLRRAFTFLLRFGKGEPRRSSFARADWWRTQLLWFILSHPRPAYRNVDLRNHLADIGVKVSAKEIRRFCIKHGIRRDERGGRPRKRATAG